MLELEQLRLLTADRLVVDMSLLIVDHRLVQVLLPHLMRLLLVHGQRWTHHVQARGEMLVVGRVKVSLVLLLLMLMMLLLMVGCGGRRGTVVVFVLLG